CGIRESDGHLICWGSRFRAINNPAPFGIAFDSLAIGASSSFYCGIRSSDSHIVCWGGDNKGVIRDIPSDTAFDSISAEQDHICGIRSSDSTQVCWGEIVWNMR
ncbi:hypothetical protein DFR33_1091, partial [Bradymonas sediminis]